MDFHIRTNFSSKIGLGHLSRSLRLANKIIKNGDRCNIYVDKHKKNLFSYNKKINFFSLYEKNHFNNEKKDSLLFLKRTKFKPGIVIVDDYRLSQIWEKKNVTWKKNRNMGILLTGSI